MNTTTSMNFLVFWSINYQLNLDLLKQQLLAFQKSGLDGVVFHPRYYPDMPIYLSETFLDIVSQVIMYAKENGLSFWLYDENGWPSGTAGGKVLTALPESKCEWLLFEPKKDCEGLFDQTDVYIQSRTGVNSLDSENVATFIEITYEGYKQGLSAEAFDYVTGFFSDEVGFLDSDDLLNDNTLPWSKEIEKRYGEKYGESIIPHLHRLFILEGYEVTKQRYWEILTDLLAETFYQPINRWCEDNGKLYTMHLKGEENIFFQIAYGGSSFQNLKQVNMPGIDALERFPGNSYYPRIASSLAKQFGDGRCLCEAMGGSGWGVNPESFMKYIKWLMDCGINHFVLHLSQYKLKASAIRDWPPSMPLHLSWQKAFPQVLDRLRDYKQNIMVREERIRTLIIAPTRGVMQHYTPDQATVLNIHNGDRVPNTKAGIISKQFNALVESCHQAGILFDVTEERMIEQHAIFFDQYIQLGKMRYNQVIVADGCVFECYERELESFSIANNIPWKLKNPESNQYLLDLAPNATNTELAAVIPIDGLSKSDISTLTLEISDPVDDSHIEVLSNQIKVVVKPSTNKEQQPFVWLKGHFHLTSQDVYIEKDKRQVFTNGPFILTKQKHDLSTTDFIEMGYPFRTDSFILEKSIHLIADAKKMMLTGVHADAVRIWVDDVELGWLFGSDFQIDFPFTKKEYMIRIELVPSTFNQYGPHHHMDGDRHLISPSQYSGEKNFADFDDSPEHTHVAGWHFVKCGVQATVVFF